MREQPLPGLPDAAFCSRFLAGMPPELGASFTRRQLFAIQQAFGGWNGRDRRRGLRFVLATPLGRYEFGLARVDPRDRRAEVLRDASLRGAVAGVATVMLIVGGLWMLMA